MNLTDVVYTLNALFLNGAMPPAPFPEIGPDPTPSGGSCEQYQVVPPEETQDLVRIGDISASPGESVRVPVFLTNSLEVEAFQLVIRYDPTLFIPASHDPGPGFTRGPILDFEGTPWESLTSPSILSGWFISQRAHPKEGLFVTAVVGSLTGFLDDFVTPFPTYPAGEGQLLCHLKGTVSRSAVPGTTIVLEPTNGPEGAGLFPPYFLRNELTHRGETRFLSLVPRTQAGALAIVGDIGFFIRGDANTNRVVDISDALYTLNYLFLGGAAPACPDAADGDDSGVLDLTDGVVILEQLFLGTGHLIPEPYPLAGSDPSPDELAACVQS